MQCLKPDENEQVACHTFGSVGRLVTPTRFEWEELSHLWPVWGGLLITPAHFCWKGFLYLLLAEKEGLSNLLLTPTFVIIKYGFFLGDS